jgi:hypothetical protein
MSGIYINYNGKTGFSRCADVGWLVGVQISYADFKNLSADIKADGEESYGITMDAADVQDFIANYEIDSVFTDAERK